MSGPPASPLSARDRPLLVYDGNCGFCLRWAERARLRTADRVDYLPYQRAAGEGEGGGDPRVHDVAVAEFERSVFLFEADGRSSRAGEAAFRTLAHAPARRWRLPLLLYQLVPGVAPLCEAAYRFVAAHRSGVLRVERLLVGDVIAPTFDRSRALFRRGLALVALIAFLSLWVQIDGLAGSHGIMPAAEQLQSAAEDAADEAKAAEASQLPPPPSLWLQRPTLLLLGASDSVLHAHCAAGAALALLMFLDVAPALCAILLWALYLSLLQACVPFLWFQWDTLLIETLLLAAFYLPKRLWRERRTSDGTSADTPPPALARWLVWFLAFRLLFESGAVKVTAGDPAWTDLTALTYHYLTQPLPHALSWFAAQLPLWWQKFSCGAMFVIELAVPFAIFAPRRLRHAGTVFLILLQVLIGATGNYGFFNLLTIVLCLSLLDNQALAALSPARLLRRRRRSAAQPTSGATGATGATGAAAVSGAACGVASAAGGLLPPWLPERRESGARRLLLRAFAACVFIVGGLQLHDVFLAGRRAHLDQIEAGVIPTLVHDGPSDAARVLEARASTFVSVNSYGLFRVMTRDRPEILVQGSVDGENWVDYEFRWKPGDVNQPPHWAQPHMPRLDWQLWFEALDWERFVLPLRPFEASGWFVQFLRRLQDGEPAVLGLLARDPFNGIKPAAVRAALFDYRFTTSEERAATGAWWHRERLYPWVSLAAR